jgi:hypothetical protein
MKKLILTLFLSIIFIACKRPCTCDGDFTVDQNRCVCAKFKGKIGYDFDSALDSLKKWYEPKFNILTNEGHYSGEGYYIEKEKINVDFVEDNRSFFLLTFIDSVSIYLNAIATNDVLDEKGNYYHYIIGLKD